jgi:IclR family transcriptional regulator, KDG regulon repressor
VREQVEGTASTRPAVVEVGRRPRKQGSDGAVKSAERVLQIIELLTLHPHGLTFAEIHTQLDVPKSSLHGLLRTMEQRGHLLADPATRQFRLGVRLWEAGQAFVRGVDLVQLCQPYLQAASDALDETVQLAVLDGLENVYLAKVESTQRLKLVSEVGRRLPAHTTALGKVLLAGLPERELEQRLEGHVLDRYTDRTIVGYSELLSALRDTRERGYGTDLGEYTPGVTCWAVPVRDHEKKVIAAISCSVPEVRLSDDTEARILEVLRQQAERLSEALGHRTAVAP